MATVGITDEELEEYLLTHVGPDYVNYPACVEFQLKLLHYIKRKKTLDK